MNAGEAHRLGFASWTCLAFMTERAVRDGYVRSRTSTS
jgi:hypothetical protein